MSRLSFSAGNGSAGDRTLRNGEKRSIPASVTVHNVLGAITIRSIAGRVFPLSVRSVRVAFGSTVVKAGIDDFHFHDLRHTFATRLVRNGLDLYKVKQPAGHKTLSMTQRYAHHHPESPRSSVEVLDRCYDSATIGQVKS